MSPDQAIDLIPPEAAPNAHRCATWALRWVGVLQEDLGQNRGRALNEILNAYRQIWGISPSSDLPWCAILASVAWAMSENTYLWGRSLSEIAPAISNRAFWAQTPLGAWIGAVYQMEQIGRIKNLWVDSRDLGLQPAERITGALLCRERAGSGSDRARFIRSSYAGHVDIGIARLPSGRLLAVGGNLSDQVQIIERDPLDPRFRGALLLP